MVHFQAAGVKVDYFFLKKKKSLAARSLQQLGLFNATDIIGGYKAWKDARLLVEMEPCSFVSAPRSLVRVP